jgi:alkanesulfonate monooxygenase SsuD/methylene tetrahydromethanopterin reductase-like flavin-dependent oxidoreductase (luciferase family)
MEFGLIYEVTVPEPTRQNAPSRFRDLVGQVQLAELVGFSSVWHVEHHFLDPLSQSSNNDVILGAYAAATSTIRLGYGVKLLPFQYNHPVRAAEAVATLDQMSDGRVEFGTGRSFSRQELEGFGIDPSGTRLEWEESLRMIVKMWEDDVFSWDSPTFAIPPCQVVPRPVQQPHPPLWLAGSGPETHSLAGEMGVGLLAFSIFTPLDDLAARLQLYREGLARCTKPIGRSINRRAAPFSLIYCGETDADARRIAGPRMLKHVQWTLDNILAPMAGWLEGKDHSYPWFKKDLFGIDPQDIPFDRLDHEDMVIVGDPETCIRKVKRYQEMGSDLLLGNFDLGLPLDEVKASIERFGKHVIPALA